MIKNFIFDLSEVIIAGYHGAEYIIEKEYGIPAKEFIKRKQETIEIFLEAMRGKIKEEEYWNQLLKGMNWDITVQDLKNAIRKNLNQPVEGTMDIIKEMKNRYHLILLSDHIEEWVDYIKEINQDINVFDKKIFSYEIGSLKSDEKTFKTILQQTGIIANETIFIDDNEENVKRAEEVGIKGIVFKSAKQLKNELNKIENNAVLNV